MMDIKVVLLQWFINFLISATCANKFSGSSVRNENISNKELAEELHKSVMRKFKKRKIYSSFTDNIWGDDIADMLLISSLIEKFVL